MKLNLWSIHPRYLYDKALMGLWRTALIARDIIEGKAKEYRIKPQLYRFINHPDPVRAINTYLYYIWLEGKERGYKFVEDRELRWKYIDREERVKVPITDGQLAFEVWNYLRNVVIKKPSWLPAFRYVECFEPNPVFQVYPGPPDPWISISPDAINRMTKYFEFSWLKIPIRICGNIWDSQEP
jgi:hypothetical protein